ncbi:MoaD/ThiS family protein [uncultured Sphingomonas sp.]|jgi:molybdopterin converting factor small subunit|uniref:MoaD/ThiS family protein n=1 Tax=uncultured Sphingomonas sp. TaxID=158754 RepID=UPI00342E440F
MQTVKIRCYGRLGESVGRELDFVIPDHCEVTELRQRLAKAFPHAAADLARPAVRVCVDDVLVGETYRLSGARLVELFPPLSGG